MNKQQQAPEGAPGRSFNPPSSPSDSSQFFEWMDEVASERGVTLREAIEQEDQQALARDGGLTEDCLLPDEVDMLLSSPNVEFVDGRPTALPGTQLEPEIQAMLDHAHSCEFCEPLLRLVQPRIQERIIFLEGLRKMAQERGRMPPTSVAPAETPPWWRSGRAYVPFAIPVGIAAVALSTWTPVSEYSWKQAVSACWPYVLNAGVGAGVLGFFATVIPKRMRPRMARVAADWVHLPPAVFGPTVAATGAMVLTTALFAYTTNTAVSGQQRTMLLSTIGAMAQPASPSVSPAPEMSLAKCFVSEEGGLRSCSAVEKIPVPGSVMAEIRRNSADVYWNVRGQRLREVELQRVNVTAQGDGTKLIAFASGEQEPLSDEGAKKYAIGTSLLAVTKNNAGEALLLTLKADGDASKYPLIAATAIPTIGATR